MTKKRNFKIAAKKTSASADERPVEACACKKGTCSCGCGCSAKSVVLAGTALAVVLSIVASVKSCCLDSRISKWVEENPDQIMQAISPEARLSKQIAADAANYSLGNPDGKFVIIEFFDYNCGWCQRTNAGLQEALAKPEAKNIRWIPIDTPIFGASSEMIARYVLAAGKQGKYQQMHDAVATGNPKLAEARTKAAKLHEELLTKNKLDKKSEDRAVQSKVREYYEQASRESYGVALAEIAKGLGLNVDQLKQDAQSDAISRKLAANQALASELGVHGVPMLIVNGKKHEGALLGDELAKAVAASAQ